MASTLFTACIILGLTFLFIFFFSLLHKSGRQKRLAEQQAKFERLVNAHSLAISEKEVFDKYVIAIDVEKGLLVHIDFSNTPDSTRLIDLHKIKTATANTEEDSIYEENKGKSVLVERQLTKLQLELTPKDTDQQKQLLPFFQLYKDGQHNFSSIKKRVEYWQDYINGYLTQIVNPI